MEFKKLKGLIKPTLFILKASLNTSVAIVKFSYKTLLGLGMIVLSMRFM